MLDFLEPKELILDDKIFIISKFPAIAGREIISNYPLSGLPKVGDYKVNEGIMLKLMCFVGVMKNDVLLKLNSSALIDNQVGSWETLVKIEAAMLEYNCSFFRDGRASTFLKDAAQNIPAWITKILTGLSAQSLQTEKQPSTN
jgi:hypothetical protein